MPNVVKCVRQSCTMKCPVTNGNKTLLEKQGILLKSIEVHLSNMSCNSILIIDRRDSEKRKEIMGLEGSEKPSWKRWHLRRLWKDEDNLKSKSQERQRRKDRAGVRMV